MQMISFEKKPSFYHSNSKKMIINQFLKTKQNRRASVVYKHIHCCLVFCIFEERLIDRFIFWTLEAGDELQKMVIPVIYVYVILFPFFYMSGMQLGIGMGLDA